MKLIQRHFILSCMLFIIFEFSSLSYAQAKPGNKGKCQDVEFGGWALNGHEQKEEADKIIEEMKACEVFVSAEMLYVDYRDSGAVFKLKEGAFFVIDGVKIGSSIGIQHTQDWIQVAEGPCQVEKVDRVIKPKGMKSPIAQVLKCSGKVMGWGRTMKKLSIIP